MPRVTTDRSHPVDQAVLATGVELPTRSPSWLAETEHKYVPDVSSVGTHGHPLTPMSWDNPPPEDPVAVLVPPKPIINPVRPRAAGPWGHEPRADAARFRPVQPNKPVRPGWLASADRPEAICFDSYVLGHPKPNCPHLARAAVDAPYRAWFIANCNRLTKEQKIWIRSLGREPGARDGSARPRTPRHLRRRSRRKKPSVKKLRWGRFRRFLMPFPRSKDSRYGGDPLSPHPQKRARKL